MKIVIAADHLGFELKRSIVANTMFSDIEFVDVGAYKRDENDDYTKRAYDAMVAMKEQSIDRSVLLCGSGVGMCIMANKFDGVRCGIGVSPEQVVSARSDDNMNVLSVAAGYTERDVVFEMIRLFIDTPYIKTPRFERRLSDIINQEKK